MQKEDETHGPGGQGNDMPVGHGHNAEMHLIYYKAIMAGAERPRAGHREQNWEFRVRVQKAPTARLGSFTFALYFRFPKCNRQCNQVEFKNS